MAELDRRPFLIDTDTASDDAVALLMALLHPQIEVEAITVVAGNVALDQAVRNALYTVELSAVPCPVFAGQAAPLVRPAIDAGFFHGPDGLGEQGYPAPTQAAAEGNAVDVIIDLARRIPELTIITLGPLTNLARALIQAPDIAKLVTRCVVMGGAANTIGNVTPAAEYNVWCDPEAARIVFGSGMPIEMVGWELCRGRANLSQTEMEELRKLDTVVARFAVDCNATAIEANRRQSGDVGLALPDPVAMAIAINPRLCTRNSRHYVQVETVSELTRGMTVVDAFDVAGDERNRPQWRALLRQPPNVSVCWELDVPGFKQMLFDLLAREPRLEEKL